MSWVGPDGQRPPRRNPAGRSCQSVIAVMVAVAAMLLVLLAGCSYMNPRLDVPVVSPLVCSVKSDWWYGGGLLGPPGCYAAP